MQKETLIYLYNSYIKEFFLELVAPAYCVTCGKKLYNSNFVCEDCKNKIKFLEYPLILHQEMVYYYGMTNYYGVMEELIKKFKFEGYKVLSSFFSNLVFNFVNDNKLDFDFIGYIPMSKGEFESRGYNQTYLIAKELSRLSGKPVINKVHKVKETKKQTDLKRDERLENLKNAFSVEGIYNGNVLIVDDVYTTGSTAHEITKAFKNKCKGNIYFVTLAKTIN
jgi:Predicted amidophosphoribosyltransferases